MKKTRVKLSDGKGSLGRTNWSALLKSQKDASKSDEKIPKNPIQIRGAVMRHP